MAAASDSGSASSSSPAKKASSRSARGSSKSASKSSSKSSSKPSSKSASSSSGSGSSRARAPRAQAKPDAAAGKIAQEASRQLLELTGKEAEGVIGLERRDDGWMVRVEVVEVRRIPDTTDVLAVYEVEVDRHGELQGYTRAGRYARGVPRQD